VLVSLKCPSSSNFDYSSFNIIFKILAHIYIYIYIYIYICTWKLILVLSHGNVSQKQLNSKIKCNKLNLNKFNNEIKTLHYIIEVYTMFFRQLLNYIKGIYCISVSIYTIFYSEAYYGFKSRGHMKSSLSPEPNNGIFKACECGEYLVELINVINRLLGDDGGLRVNSAAMLRNTRRSCRMHQWYANNYNNYNHNYRVGSR